MVKATEKAPTQKAEAKIEVKQQTPKTKAEVKKETPATQVEKKKEVIAPAQKTEDKKEVVVTPTPKQETAKEQSKDTSREVVTPTPKEDKKEIVQEGPKEKIKPITHEGQKKELLPDVVVKHLTPSKEDDHNKPVEEAPVVKEEVKHEYNVPEINFNPGDCLMDKHLTDGLNKKYGGTGFGSYQGKAKTPMCAAYTQLLSGNMSLDQAKKQLVGKYVEDGYQIKDIKMINMDIPQEEWAIYMDGSDYIEKHGGIKAFNAEKQTNFFTMWNHNGQDQRHFTRVVYLLGK